MVTLLLLGFTLGLDSFRVSLVLGTLKPRPMQQAQIAVAFGLCDGLAPLAGLYLGQTLVQYAGVWVEHLGPAVICAYGIYVIYVARRYAGRETMDGDRWIVLGLPLSLSLDNLVAGAGLGMIGFPVLLSVVVIGAMSGLMALAGLRFGSAAVKRLGIKSELVSGIALVLIAITLAFDLM